MNGEAGKGDSRRVATISREEERQAWDNIWPGSADPQPWKLCERHRKGYNKRNPCPLCELEKQ